MIMIILICLVIAVFLFAVLNAKTPLDIETSDREQETFIRLHPKHKKS